MSWSVEGTYFENCNCTFACPCTVTTFATPATQERCQVVLAFHISRGQVDGTDVSGHSFAVIADSPAQMLNGNWRVGLLIDDKASKEQADKLAGDIEIEVEDFVPEGMSEPTKLVGVGHPANSTLTIARPTQSRIKAFGMEFQNGGKSAFSAPYRWSA